MFYAGVFSQYVSCYILHLIQHCQDGFLTALLVLCRSFCLHLNRMMDPHLNLAKAALCATCILAAHSRRTYTRFCRVAACQPVLASYGDLPGPMCCKLK